MEYRSIKGFTGLGQIGFLFAFIGLGFVLTGAVQYIFAMQMLPAGAKLTDSNVLLQAMLLPQNIGLARASQVLSTLVLFFIPALLYNYVSNGKSLLWLGFSKHINAIQVAIGFLLILFAGIAAAPLADCSKYVVHFLPRLNTFAKSLETAYAAQAAALSNLSSMQEYIVALFIMAFFPALFEEVFFRGALQNLLVRWWQKPILAIIITSVVFSLIHSSVYLFLSRALLGFVLGYMFYITKNIWVNIIAHFINNALVLSALYIYKKKTGKINLDIADPTLHWSAGLLAVGMLVGLFILLYICSKQNSSKIHLQEYAQLQNSATQNPITQN